MVICDLYRHIYSTFGRHDSTIKCIEIAKETRKRVAKRFKDDADKQYFLKDKEVFVVNDNLLSNLVKVHFSNGYVLPVNGDRLADNVWWTKLSGLISRNEIIDEFKNMKVED